MAAQAKGKVTGGQKYTIPGWFKLSFLDIKDDVRAAKKANHHILLFFHLDECPYCARVLDENFRRGKSKTFMQKHFDAIAINVRGSSNVSWIDDSSMSERQLTSKIGVYATPTLVFLDGSGKVVLRMNGYRTPQDFHYVLQYVHKREYKRQDFLSYLKKQQKKPVYRFTSHPQLVSVKNLKHINKPVAVLFENSDCTGCAEFHRKVLNHPAVLKQLKKFVFVRYNSYSSNPIFDTNGKRTTPRQWVKQLKLNHIPAMILFHKGEEIIRIDGRVYHYHMSERLRYVSHGLYEKYTTFGLYQKVRRKELMRTGKTIDYSE
jgi:thioredoxin-related protein